MATRPRDVRASRPARTRNGSHTSSTVLRLLPHGDRERRDADRAAAEAHDQRLEHGAVEPVQPEVVDVVEGERGPGHLRG